MAYRKGTVYGDRHARRYLSRFDATVDGFIDSEGNVIHDSSILCEPGNHDSLSSHAFGDITACLLASPAGPIPRLDAWTVAPPHRLKTTRYIAPPSGGLGLPRHPCRCLPIPTASRLSKLSDSDIRPISRHAIACGSQSITARDRVAADYVRSVRFLSRTLAKARGSRSFTKWIS